MPAKTARIFLHVCPSAVLMENSWSDFRHVEGTTKVCRTCVWQVPDTARPPRGRCTANRTEMGAVWQRRVRDIDSTTCKRHRYKDFELLVRAHFPDSGQRDYNAGENVFCQGDPAERLYFIKTGRIKLTRLFEDGTKAIIDILQEGDFLGEYVPGGESVHSASAECIGLVTMWEFVQEDFEKLILDYPEEGLRVIKSLARRVSFLRNRAGTLSASTLEERLYRVLREMAAEHGVHSGAGWTLPFALTHEELGFLLGAHRVSITNALKTLKNAGKISIEGRRFSLLK